MSARGIDIEYTPVNAAVAWPVQPWAALEPAAGSQATPEAADATAGAVARKARDRGASAVEWVVITAIVVAIVTGVGVLIANAVSAKAHNACTEIANTDTTTGGTAGTNC